MDAAAAEAEAPDAEAPDAEAPDAGGLAAVVGLSLLAVGDPPWQAAASSATAAVSATAASWRAPFSLVVRWQPSTVNRSPIVR
jgi:hypothetical protein